MKIDGTEYGEVVDRCIKYKVPFLCTKDQLGLRIDVEAYTLYFNPRTLELVGWSEYIGG